LRKKAVHRMMVKLTPVQDFDVRATDVDVKLTAGVFAVAVAVTVAAELPSVTGSIN